MLLRNHFYKNKMIELLYSLGASSEKVSYIVVDILNGTHLDSRERALLII